MTVEINTNQMSDCRFQLDSCQFFAEMLARFSKHTAYAQDLLLSQPLYMLFVTRKQAGMRKAGFSKAYFLSSP